MDQQPVRRRRRRRASKAKSETIAWITYIFSLGQRVSRWAGLVLLVTLILILGLGAPLKPMEDLLAFWGHW